MRLASEEAEWPKAAKGFEPLLQSATRLHLMAVLMRAKKVEFAQLTEVTRCSTSAMSKHLAVLEWQEFLQVSKVVMDGRQRTLVAATREGRRMFERHEAALKRLLAGEGWK